MRTPLFGPIPTPIPTPTPSLEIARNHPVWEVLAQPHQISLGVTGLRAEDRCLAAQAQHGLVER
jgi:hypothetical protein